MLFRLAFLHTVPSSAVTRLQSNTVSATVVQLSWQPIPTDELNGLLRLYTISLRGLNGQAMSYNTTATNITIGSLTPCNNYIWNVKALTVGYSPVSLNSSVTTLPLINGMSKSMLTISKLLSFGISFYDFI